jgi:GNAT superfamily N-acetyltransferase
MAADSILVRRARPADAAALGHMLDRCSPRTRYERFHGVVEAIPPGYLRRCLHGDGQEARVAESVTGELVGLASTGPVAPEVCELGILVEDRWQGKGIGRLLAADLTAHAAAAGATLLRLELCRAHPWLLDYVVANLPVAARLTDGCDVTVDVRLDVRLGVSPAPRSVSATAPPRPSSAAPRPGAPART